MQVYPFPFFILTVTLFFDFEVLHVSGSTFKHNSSNPLLLHEEARYANGTCSKKYPLLFSLLPSYVGGVSLIDVAAADGRSGTAGTGKSCNNLAARSIKNTKIGLPRLLFLRQKRAFLSPASSEVVFSELHLSGMWLLDCQLIFSVEELMELVEKMNNNAPKEVKDAVILALQRLITRWSSRSLTSYLFPAVEFLPHCSGKVFSLASHLISRCVHYTSILLAYPWVFRASSDSRKGAALEIRLRADRLCFLNDSCFPPTAVWELKRRLFSSQLYFEMEVAFPEENPQYMIVFEVPLKQGKYFPMSLCAKGKGNISLVASPFLPWQKQEIGTFTLSPKTLKTIVEPVLL